MPQCLWNWNAIDCKNLDMRTCLGLMNEWLLPVNHSLDWLTPPPGTLDVLEHEHWPHPQSRPLRLARHVPVQSLPATLRHVTIAQHLQHSQHEPTHPQVHPANTYTSVYLCHFSSSTDHDDCVSPVAGVAAGVTQLLQTSAPVTVESEQEVSDVLVLRQLTQLWTRVILWSRTCAVEASITLASPGQLKLMKSIRQRG